FGCLPVLAENQLVGIITEIDLLRGYLVAAASTGGRMTVKDAMQDLMIIVTPEDLLSTAYQRMQGGIVRHLPILDDAEKLVGVITDRDIRQAGDFGEPYVSAQELTDRFAMRTVNEIMTTQVRTVRSDTTLTAAAELFLTHKFGCLPVIRNDDTLEGILTVADLLRLCAATLDADHVSL
ncbi:MAG: CBS domain-containing protein, partial [Candidatus Tectomicrobia bacterium]|nr:CBS domain-containing protein [Candidatus Tectomicrobia bacterium]